MKWIPNTGHGRRYETIVLEVGVNKEGCKKELYQLEEYFKKKKGENYSVKFTTYGRANKMLYQVIDYYLKAVDDDGIALLNKSQKEKLFININDLFVQNKVVGTFGIVAGAAIAESHRLFKKKEVVENAESD